MATDDELISKAYAVTDAAGVYPTPKPGTVPLGPSKLGRSMYGNQKLLNLQAPQAGKGMIQGLQ